MSLIDEIPAYLNVGQPPFDNFYLVIRKRVFSDIRYIANYECDSRNAEDFFPIMLFPYNIYSDDFEDCLRRMIAHLKELKYL